MITKEEFNNFLDSFNKEAGEFTDEELYEIGCKYKEVPTSQKRWDDLVSLLGVEKTGEQFRLWIKSRQYKDGTIKKNVTLISGQTIEDISFDEFQDKTEEIKRDLYKQQIKTRDVLNSYRRTLRDEARIEDFQSLLVDAIKDIEPLPPVKVAKLENTDKEAVVLFSDLHLGVNIDSFFNTYNLDVARARVQKYTDYIIDYCQSNHVRRLNFLQLGDAIQGIIHVTNRIEQEFNVVDQIKNACEILANMLNQLQEAAPEIIYRSVTDNHSRALPSYKENIEAENFNKIIDFYLKARLSNTNIVFEDNSLDDEVGLFELLNGKKMLYVHGHRDNYNTIVQNWFGVTHEYIDYIVLGHYHSSKVKTFQGTKVIVNGSIVGTEAYAYSKRLFGDPEQSLLMFDGNNFSINYVNLK